MLLFLCLHNTESTAQALQLQTHPTSFNYGFYIEHVIVSVPPSYPAQSARLQLHLCPPCSVVCVTARSGESLCLCPGYFGMAMVCIPTGSNMIFKLTRTQAQARLSQHILVKNCVCDWLLAIFLCFDKGKLHVHSRRSLMLCHTLKHWLFIQR